MPPAQSRELSNKLKQLTRKIASLQLSGEEKQQLVDEISKATEEVNTSYVETLDKLNDEVKFHYSRKKAEVPAYLLKLTIGEIREAGGSYGVDEETGDVVLQIPISLVPSDSKITSGIRPPSAKKDFNRPVLNDMSTLVNKIQVSALKNKRPRITTATPTHTMTTRKKVARTSRYSPTELDNTMIYSNTRAFRSIAKPVASKLNSTLRSSRMPVSSKLQVQASSKPESQASSSDVSMENHQHQPSTTSSKASIRLTDVNPKTPGGQHRLLKKQPRLAKEDEIIITINCSKAGTPLFLKQQANK